MKKIAKISLVAAIAVAGLTTANAQPLEEAIKNVDVTGSVVYRYNDYNNDASGAASNTSTTNNNYKVALGLASKVNEDVKFNSRFLVANDDGNFAGPLDSQAAADSNVGVTLSNAYFGYTGLKNTTVNVGKQGLTTPWTVAVDSDGNEQTGTGILALSTVGPVTLAGAIFNQTNLNQSSDSSLNGVALYKKDRRSYTGFTATDTAVYNIVGDDVFNGNEDVATIGAIVAAGPVTIDAWYLDMDKQFDTFTVGAKSTPEFAGIKFGIDARYASLTLDKEVAQAIVAINSADATKIEDNNAMAKLVLTADAGLIDGKLAYAMTDKNGGLTALDNDASTTLLGWNLNANGKADADYWQAVVGVDILSNLNLSANYGNIEYIEMANSSTEIEEEEVYAQLLYKMSKNLTTYVRYGTYEKETRAATTTENNDDTRGRLQVEYTF